MELQQICDIVIFYIDFTLKSKRNANVWIGFTNINITINKITIRCRQVPQLSSKFLEVARLRAELIYWPGYLKMRRHE